MEDMNNGQKDPAEKYPKPPFPKQDQPAPGTEAKLRPQADHGEDSYKGSGKLEGKRAIITGGDSGIGRAVAIAFSSVCAFVFICYLDYCEVEDANFTA